MNKIFFVFLILTISIFTTSCENNQTEISNETNIAKDSLTNDFLVVETLTEENPLDFLKQRKIEIDSFLVQNPEKFTVLVKRIDQSDLFQIENKFFPEDVETTFNIVKDHAGNIIYACEIPHSESGDWFVVLNHYFDENGKTFAFEKLSNEFNSGCAEITYETITEYYDANLVSIKSEYKLVDENGKNLSKNACILMDYEYEVVSDYEHYQKTNNIKATHQVYK